MGGSAGGGVENTEERILNVCKQRCRKNGPRGLTTRAAAVGVNAVTLFRHFPTKAHLVRSMVTHTVSRMGETMLVEPRRDATELTADLAHCASVYLDHIMPVADMVRVGLAEARWDKDLRRSTESVRDRCPGHWRCTSRGAPSAVRTRMFAAHVRPEPLEPRAVANGVAAVFAAALHRGVGPPPPPGQDVRIKQTEE